MYRLLIVEDEEIEREGMRDLVDWKRMGIGEVLAVESAEEALELIEDNNVDMLLTDIRLPTMSGLDLAQKLSSTHPGIKVVIISCMEDFEYAKKAIDLDAYGFLSKPLDMAELEKVITKVTNTFMCEKEEKIERERLNKLLNESLPLLKERFFINLIQGIQKQENIRETLEYFKIQFADGQFVVIVTEINNYDSVMTGKDMEEVNIALLKVLDCINNIHTKNKVFTFHIGSGRYFTIMNSSSHSEGNLYNETIGFSKKVQERISRVCNFDTTVGIGKGVTELTDLKNSYKKACEAVDFMFFAEPGQIIYYKDIYYKKEFDSMSDFESIEKKILSNIELCNKEALNKNIDRLFAKFEGGAWESDTYIRNLSINLIAKCSLLLQDMNENYEKIFGKESLIWDKILRSDTIFDIHEWIRSIFCRVIDYLYERRDDYNKKVIKDILKIIEERYGENLTITDIAKEVYLSMKYTSIIFKREMGETFTNYLIRYRLKKASQMLKDTNLKVYQIGNLVGYSNISHFCTIFKNVYGLSPNEYREKVYIKS